MEDVIIASVVPAVMHSFNSAIIKYFGLTPIIVGPGIRTGIRIATTNPKETGADRIVDAVAGYELYGGPVIVVDFGTATTYDLVTEDGRFVGGVTFRESVLLRMLFGSRQQSFLKLKSESRSIFWQKIR